jgi:hypothetical protein
MLAFLPSVSAAGMKSANGGLRIAQGISLSALFGSSEIYPASRRLGKERTAAASDAQKFPLSNSRLSENSNLTNSSMDSFISVAASKDPVFAR